MDPTQAAFAKVLDVFDGLPPDIRALLRECPMDPRIVRAALDSGLEERFVIVAIKTFAAQLHKIEINQGVTR